MIRQFANSYLSLCKNCPKYSHILAKRDVHIQVKDALLTMTFPFVSGQKLFYIHNQYTFITLQEALQMEVQTPVELDLEGTNLSMSSNLFKYLLNDQTNKSVKVLIQDEEFNLIPSYQHKEANLISKSATLKNSPVIDYKNMVDVGIDPSHANTLSWFLNQVNMKDTLTLVEVTRIMKKSLPILRQPIKDRSYDLQHKINVLEAEINKHQDILDQMSKEAQQSGYNWLSFLFVLSVLQILGFYYGIYMVEDWGWDVCEPVTYSLQCVTVVLGMIFYIKFRKQRELENIRWAFIFKKQTKQRRWKERWNHLNTLIQLKQNEKHAFELRKLILQNRINYHYYVQQIKQEQI